MTIYHILSVKGQLTYGVQFNVNFSNFLLNYMLSLRRKSKQISTQTKCYVLVLTIQNIIKFYSLHTNQGHKL